MIAVSCHLFTYSSSEKQTLPSSPLTMFDDVYSCSIYGPFLACERSKHVRNLYTRISISRRCFVAKRHLLMTNRKADVNRRDDERCRMYLYKDTVRANVIRFKSRTFKSRQTRGTCFIEEMNSNEVELRCYANGNVNKADEVLRGPSHSPYPFIEWT